MIPFFLNQTSLAFVISSLFLAACQSTSVISSPQAKSATQYSHVEQQPDQTLSWSAFIHDQKMIEVVNLALIHNHDLHIAALRIKEAQTLYGIQRAERLPSLMANLGFERNHLPADLSGTGRSMTTEQYSIGLGMNQWELDLWGRIRSLNEATLQQFLATQYNQIAVRNSIIQQTLNTYLTVSELEKRIEFAQRAVQSYEKSAEIFKRRYDVGAGAKVEYMQAQTLLTNGKSLLNQLIKNKQLTEHYLLQLIGQPIAIPKLELDQVNLKNSQIQLGLPSDLLLNRPDILQAEKVLQSKQANIQAARAAFFPRIALTGRFGTASNELDSLFKSGSGIWSFAPSISVPIFTAGRLKNNVSLAEVRRDLAVLDYEKSIQNAFREVADALTAQRHLTEQLAIQKHGLIAFRETSRLAQLRYENGSVGYLDVLDAQRNLLNAEQQWIETQSQLIKAYISVYFSLGGDITSQLPS